MAREKPRRDVTAAAAALASGGTAGLLGEVVTWSCQGVSVTKESLVRAMTAAGLDISILRDMLPRYAFARACQELADNRVIRLLDETDDDMRFQFTAEARRGEQYQYNLEAIVTLNKKSGHLSCAAAPDLVRRVQELVDTHRSARTANDVTNLIQRIFQKRDNAQLFLIRPQGGCWLVLQEHLDLVDAIDRFLQSLGGKLWRLPIPRGTGRGEASVQSIVEAGLHGLIAEHRKAIAELDDKSKTTTLDRRAAEIARTRLRIEAHADYLGETQANLLTELAKAKNELAARVAALRSVSE